MPRPVKGAAGPYLISEWLAVRESLANSAIRIA